jgi:hypothetical protein
MKRQVCYLRYLLRHKWFVLIAGLRIHAPLWRLLAHDLSKFRASEWGAYLQKFYGLACTKPECGKGHLCPSCRERKAKFKLASHKHKHRNEHHWEHWVDPVTTVPLPMPPSCVLEMVADWAGAGRAIAGKWELRSWYEANKHRLILHQSVASDVERWVGILDAKLNANGILNSLGNDNGSMGTMQ